MEDRELEDLDNSLSVDNVNMANRVYVNQAISTSCSISMSCLICGEDITHGNGICNSCKEAIAWLKEIKKNMEG